MNWLIKNKTGCGLEKIGIILFLLFFWLPSGFYLGGDAYFLGNYHSSLEVVFPYSGIGILLVFFGKYLTKTVVPISQKQILFFLFLLAGFGVSAQFSSRPETSILFLIIWTIGLFAASFGTGFCLEKNENQWLFFAGILLGYAVLKFKPSFHVSSDLLAIASLLLSVHLILTEKFKAKLLMLLVLFWIIFSGQNLGLIFLAILLWLFSRIWLPRTQRIEQRKMILFSLFFLAGLTIFGFFQKDFDLSGVRSGIPIFNYWLNFIFGFGEGQFLVTLQNFSPVYLIPQAMIFPNWGIVLSLFEKGIFGVFLILILSFNSFFFGKKPLILPVFLFFCFWVFSTDYLSTENGILLSLVFLFAQKVPFSGHHEFGTSGHRV